MNTQIVRFIDLVQQWKAGLLSEEQIEHLYGSETMQRVVDHVHEEYYAHYYA